MFSRNTSLVLTLFKMSTSESCSYTYGKLIHFSHVWTIEHFISYLNDNGEEYLESTTFSPTTNDQIGFSLSIYPQDETSGNVGLYLYLECGKQKMVNAKFQFSILGANGEKLRTDGMFVDNIFC